MMKHMNAGWAVLAGMFLLPGAASAQVILQQRCNADNLEGSQAEARLEWARRCALAKVGNPSAYYDTGIPASTGGNLVDYQEPGDVWSGMNMYTGAVDGGEINISYITKMYMSGPTYQGVDAQGYYRWYRDASRKKPRPLYPTFGSMYDINNASNVQLFPHPTLADCRLYHDRNGTQPTAGAFYVNGYCENSSPPPTSLTSGVPLSVSGAAGASQHYTLNVPAGAANVMFETSGGTGDVDLYVRYGATAESAVYDCRSALGGNLEGCNMPSPAGGTWYVMLKGYTAYSGVSLKGTVYNRLTDGVASPASSGAQGSEQYWALEVPAGMSQLTFTLAGVAGHTGDADLYVRRGMGPTLSAFDCRPYIGGNSEVCSFSAPGAGPWYVMVRGWSAYTGVTVTGDYY